jgi:hypothetical protein
VQRMASRLNSAPTGLISPPPEPDAKRRKTHPGGFNRR